MGGLGTRLGYSLCTFYFSRRETENRPGVHYDIRATTSSGRKVETTFDHIAGDFEIYHGSKLSA